MSEQTNDELENQQPETIEGEFTEVAEAEKVDAGEVTPEEEEGELVVHFGEEKKDEEKEHAPAWVKELRKQNREQAKKLKEFEQREAERNKPKEPALRKKPTLADFDYDENAFDAEYQKWVDEKRAVEESEKAAKAKKEADEKAWGEVVASFEEGKKALKVADYQEKQDEVQAMLSEMQQSIILDITKNPALFVYGLGANESKLNELKEITNPVKFTAAIVRLEESMKQTTRKAPPPPEKQVSSGTAIGGSPQKTLDKLREEADKTGDYTKLHKYKREMKNKG
jgi:hypothetical protein